MKYIVYLLFLLLPMNIYGQEKENLNEASVSVGVNSNDCWELEGAYLRRLNPYIGIGAGIHFFNQYSTKISGQGPYISGTPTNISIPAWTLSDSKKPAGLSLNPYIRLNTPKLFKIFGGSVSLFAEPGMYLTWYLDKNQYVYYWDGEGYNIQKSFHDKKGDWVYWNARTGISIGDESATLSIGYSASNLDVYSYRRNIVVDGVNLSKDLPKKHFLWGLFVSAAYKF